MAERRRASRMDLQVTLLLRELGSAVSQGVISVAVLDISQTGIGFVSERPLNVGSTYESNIHIWTGDIIHAFIDVVRCAKTENGYKCGGIFIGMPESDWCRIRVYETFRSFDKTP